MITVTDIATGATFELTEYVPPPGPPFRLDIIPVLISRLGVPNRLKGATINQDGDAI